VAADAALARSEDSPVARDEALAPASSLLDSDEWTRGAEERSEGERRIASSPAVAAPTRRICARTCDSCRSYSQAACCRIKGRLTENWAALAGQSRRVRLGGLTVRPLSCQ
jgi:hypothetical protein